MSKVAASKLSDRTLAAVAVGVVVAIATNGSNMIWCGYPASFTNAAILIQVLGYAIAGVVIAAVLGMKPQAATG